MPQLLLGDNDLYENLKIKVVEVLYRDINKWKDHITFTNVINQTSFAVNKTNQTLFFYNLIM